jgi:three-Cys-motif partner protein
MSPPTIVRWAYRRHTRAKHEILEKYLEAWLRILGTRHERLLYVDGFAGRGEYDEGQAGSPLIAMRVAQELVNAGKVGEVVCIFVESDADNMRNLKEMIGLCGRTFPDVVVELLEARFDDVSGRVMNRVRELAAPAFFFVDPFGFTGVPFNTIASIMRLPHTEVFLTFMARDIHRFLTAPQLEERFDDLFGTTRWRELASLRDHERENALRELYETQLRTHGGIKYSWAFRVCEDRRERTLYYLIHATNHFKGLKVMKEIMYSQGAMGTFAFLGPRDFPARQQLRLFEATQDSLREFLVNRLSGKTVSFDEVVEVTYMSTPCIEKDCRAVLKALEKDGTIHVGRLTAKTSRGLSEIDRITFP